MEKGLLGCWSPAVRHQAPTPHHQFHPLSSHLRSSLQLVSSHHPRLPTANQLVPSIIYSLQLLCHSAHLDTIYTTHHHPSTLLFSTAFLPRPALTTCLAISIASLPPKPTTDHDRLGQLLVDPPYLLHQLRRRGSFLPCSFFSLPCSFNHFHYLHSHAHIDSKGIQTHRHTQSIRQTIAISPPPHLPPIKLSSPWLPQVCRLGHLRSRTIFTASVNKFSPSSLLNSTAISILH